MANERTPAGKLIVEKRGEEFFVTKDGQPAREQPFPTLPSALYWIAKQDDKQP